MIVLYVDDEIINLDLFRFHIEKHYQIFTCTSGKEALDILQNHPDITSVISDVKMPGMSGLEFIMEARRRYPKKKYYLLSGFDQSEEALDALEKGYVLNYFKKPCNMDKIIQTIGNHLSTCD